MRFVSLLFIFNKLVLLSDFDSANKAKINNYFKIKAGHRGTTSENSRI